MSRVSAHRSQLSSSTLRWNSPLTTIGNSLKIGIPLLDISDNNVGVCDLTREVWNPVFWVTKLKGSNFFGLIKMEFPFKAKSVWGFRSWNIWTGLLYDNLKEKTIEVASFKMSEQTQDYDLAVFLTCITFLGAMSWISQWQLQCKCPPPPAVSLYLYLFLTVINKWDCWLGQSCDFP